MAPQSTLERACALIDDLRKLPAETPWVEFKENDAGAPRIGQYISALSNAARLADQHFGYLVWGIRDGDHEPVGTNFQPATAKEKSQPLEMWLTQHLQPGIAFDFQKIDYRGHNIVLLRVAAAVNAPIEFNRNAYVRIGSATPKLSDHPERQRALWAKLQSYAWESGVASQFLSEDDVLKVFDYTVYFDLTRQPLPDNRAGIFEKLAFDQLIERDVGGRWNITNLGAILFAKQLEDFGSSVTRKAVRFVAYDGPRRTDMVTHRQDGKRGYAAGFQGLVDFIDGLLPRNEHIGRAFRQDHPLYPSIAIRELVANALIHQDMTITGAGPMIELFSDRMEITNPGEPLVAPERFLDAPPRSRNEALASLMRRMRLCEEQGTGIDKVIDSVEMHQSPPPDFRKEGAAMRVVLFAPRRFADMSPEEAVRACYQHAALKYVGGQKMTNSSLRERLGISGKNAAQASRVIRAALDKQLIRPAETDRPRAGYVPFWA